MSGGGERLAGRRILVVGGGTRPDAGPGEPPNNGQAICVACAREGAAVAVADIATEAAEACVALVAAHGARGMAITGDASDASACERMVTEAAEAMSGLDGVVVNAGTGEGLGLEGTTPDAWDRVLALNLRGPFAIARAALPLMDSGAFVFIGSVAGLRPGTFSPSYDASKAGLIGLSKHVALEGARRGIRANVLAPGLIDTPMGRAASAARPARERTPIPLGRQGRASEVADAALFLLCDESSYITAQTLVVDGGLDGLGPVR